MYKATYYKADGKKGRARALPDSLFDGVVNESVLHTVVKAYLANQRQGTHSAKTRAEVSGGNSKPWRQKGTGRARQGTRSAPHWAGGGVVFGPHPRSYEQRMPAKMRRSALRGALSAKQAEGAVRVVTGFELDAIKTKSMLERLEAWKAEGKVLLVLPTRDPTVERSSRNLQAVRVILADSLNVVDLLEADTVVFTREALDRAQEVYA
jgi:large subunit ribosomal protein L4